MRAGLVIQGPILSSGRHGKSAHIAAYSAKREDVTTFDCTENIHNLFERYQKYFLGGVVIVTWKDQPCAKLANLPVIQLDDRTRPLPTRPASQPALTINNKLRQFASSIEGARKLQHAGADVIIKIRTDQSLELERLLESTLRIAASFERKIMVPWIDPSSFGIPDFYFGGRTEWVLEFFESILGSSSIDYHESVHIDIVLKHAIRVLNIHAFDKSLFPKSTEEWIPHETESILRYMLTEVYKPGPKCVFDSMVWRGEPMAAPLKARDKIFEGDVLRYPVVLSQLARIAVAPLLYNWGRAADARYGSSPISSLLHLRRTLRQIVEKRGASHE